MDEFPPDECLVEDGLTKESSLKEFMEKKAREYTANLVKELGGKCVICGLVDHPVVYDFHHVDPSTKEFAISSLAGGCRWERLLAEAQKCVLLCTICHRKLHFGIVSLDVSRQSNRVNETEGDS